MPLATALLVAGCCSSSKKSASLSHGAQGAPAVAQTTEVMSASGGIEVTGTAEIPLHKEELVVGKRQVSNGGLLIRTVVQTESVSQPVELSREEYIIERIPPGEAVGIEAAARSTETAFQGKEFYIPLTREEPVTSKRVWLSEKVQVGKRVETDRQTVSAPTRSEDVQVTRLEGKPGTTLVAEPMAVAPTAPAQPDSLSLAREELVVGKRVVDSGGAKVQKVVRTQVASQAIDLKREEPNIDRAPVAAGQPANADFSPREIRITLSREEPIVSTRIQPVEWVRVRKQIHADTQTVSGSVRKENIEIVKLEAETPGVGGTGPAGQSGATVLSESGSGKEITVKGKALCGKCQLHQAASCQNVLQVQDGKKTLSYWVVANDVSRNFHANVCKEAKPVSATGSVKDVAGKLEFTATKLELVK